MSSGRTTPSPRSRRKSTGMHFSLPSRASFSFVKHSPPAPSQEPSSLKRRKSNNRAARIITPSARSTHAVVDTPTLLASGLCPQLPPLASSSLRSFAESTPELVLPQDLFDAPYKRPRVYPDTFSPQNARSPYATSSSKWGSHTDISSTKRARPTTFSPGTRAKIPAHPPPPPPLPSNRRTPRPQRSSSPPVPVPRSSDLPSIPSYSSMNPDIERARQNRSRSPLMVPPSSELPSIPSYSSMNPELERSRQSSPKSRRYGFALDYEQKQPQQRDSRRSFLPSPLGSHSREDETTTSPSENSPLSSLSPLSPPTPSDGSSAFNSALALEFPRPPSVEVAVSSGGTPLFSEEETSAVREFLRKRWGSAANIKNPESASGLGLENMVTSTDDEEEAYWDANGDSDFSWEAEESPERWDARFGGETADDDVSQVLRALRSCDALEPTWGTKGFGEGASSEATSQEDSTCGHVAAATAVREDSTVLGLRKVQSEVLQKRSCPSGILWTQEPVQFDHQESKTTVADEEPLKPPHAPALYKRPGRKTSAPSNIVWNPDISSDSATSLLADADDRRGSHSSTRQATSGRFASQVSLTGTTLTGPSIAFADRPEYEEAWLNLVADVVEKKERPTTFIPAHQTSALDRLEASLRKLKGHGPNHHPGSKSLDASPRTRSDFRRADIRAIFADKPPIPPPERAVVPLPDVNALRSRVSAPSLAERYTSPYSPSSAPPLPASSSLSLSGSALFLERPCTRPRTRPSTMLPPARGQTEPKSFMHMDVTPEQVKPQRRSSLGAEKMRKMLARASRGIIELRKSWRKGVNI